MLASPTGAISCSQAGETSISLRQTDGKSVSPAVNPGGSGPRGFFFPAAASAPMRIGVFCCPCRVATFGGWIKTSPCLLPPAALWRSVWFGRSWRSLATVLVIWVLAWLALPPVLKWLLRKQSRGWWGGRHGTRSSESQEADAGPPGGVLRTGDVCRPHAPAPSGPVVLGLKL